MNKDIRKRPLIYAIRITPAQVNDSIRQARNSKVVGPGGVSMVHLKHIVPHGTRALADTFTASHATSTIPTVWKKSINLPSWNLSEPPRKKFILPPHSLLWPRNKKYGEELTWNLATAPPNSNTSTWLSGFQPKHSRVTAPNENWTAIADGINARKHDRTVLVALDLSKAFDTEGHAILLELINNATLPRPQIRWLATYLCGHPACTLSRRPVRFEVPKTTHCTDLIPILRNDAPTHPPHLFVSNADNFTIIGMGRTIPNITDSLNQCLKTLCDFLVAIEWDFRPNVRSRYSQIDKEASHSLKNRNQKQESRRPKDLQTSGRHIRPIPYCRKLASRA